MTEKSRILVVDDDPNLRKTLSDILRVKGYEPVAAATGAEAIAAMEREPFSLALIDLMLPDMSGLEVMVRIKTLSPLTEAIILTGHASMDTAIEATKQGAYSYLLKPYEMDELLQTIHHGIERQQSQAEIRRLASFLRLHPSPVVELDLAGNVTYVNPAAEDLFPDLKSRGLSHPLLTGVVELLDTLRKIRRQSEITREAEIRGTTYELRISYIEEVDLIRIFAVDITQRKWAEKKIHILATTDSLTGIANRHEFSAVLTKEMDRAKRYGTPLSLVMYDLDHFKRVNDSFGHDVGDQVLQTTTDVVKSNIRTHDVAARWGGEEFMVLMPQTDLTAAAGVAEKLRQAIAEHRFDRVGEITVSLGVTACEPRDNVNSLLKRVDNALYQAKANGRNRIEILKT